MRFKHAKKVTGVHISHKLILLKIFYENMKDFIAFIIKFLLPHVFLCNMKESAVLKNVTIHIFSINKKFPLHVRYYYKLLTIKTTFISRQPCRDSVKDNFITK